MVDLHHHGDRDVRDGLLDLAVNVYAGPRPAWLDAALRAGIESAGAYPNPSEAEAVTAARHGRAAGEVLATAGAAEAFTLIARWRRWRRPVVVHPQFTEPHAALSTAGHSVHEVVLEPPFELDPERIPDDADLVVLGNPTNPTGVMHPAAAVRALRREGRMVVVDEAFMDTEPGEPESVAHVPDVLVLRSLTKQWGIPGIRAGYVLGDEERVRELRTLQPPWSVSSPAIAAMLACGSVQARAESERRAHQMQAWRRHLENGLHGLGIAHIPSRASFVLARVGVGVRTNLRERGIAVRRGDTFPGLDDNWIRIAVRDERSTDIFLTGLVDALR